jgi:signal transduction histidine kinase
VAGADGRPLAVSQGFRDLFGPDDRVYLVEDDGARVAVDRWPPPGGPGVRTLELAGGDRRQFDVRSCQLLEAPGAGSQPASVWLFDQPSLADPAAEVASLVSHELRTPLTVLHAALQLLDRSLPREPASPPRRYLGEALVETRQLGVLTSHLLEATRIQGGRLRLRLQDLSLTELVRAACSEAEPLSRGQRIVLSAPNDPVTVTGDPARLREIVTNLLVNAIIYAPGTERIEVAVWRTETEAAFSVHDHGPGLDPERLARLSQPFFQLPRRDRPSRGGLGLGLYLSRELAQLHGGRLAITSTQGRGSTFTVWLPLAARRVREDARPSPHPSRRVS